MASPFDSLQDATFSTVTNIMGYDAEWTPKAGGETQSAKVLYNGPTEKEKLFSADYDPLKIMMEYKEGDFAGLFDASRVKNSREIVQIDSLGEFYIKSVKKKWDGKTYEAQLEVKI
jgi:hypothetical protein